MDKVYLIHCGTGCTCCNNENHYRGPYKTKEEAKKRIHYFYYGNWYPLASQYARRGRYSVKECYYEEISGNRVIIGDKVYSGIEFIKLNENGSLNPEDSDYFDID